MVSFSKGFQLRPAYCFLYIIYLTQSKRLLYYLTFKKKKISFVFHLYYKTVRNKGGLQVAKSMTSVRDGVPVSVY